MLSQGIKFVWHQRYPPRRQTSSENKDQRRENPLDTPCVKLLKGKLTFVNFFDDD
nr:hypothetical protein [Janthinobacterium sp. Marseille]